METLAAQQETSNMPIETGEALSIAEANAELLESTVVGRIIKPVYEAALAAEPTLESVRLTSIDPQENPKLAFAQPGWSSEGGVSEVHIQLGDEALETAQTVLKEHPDSIAIMAELTGVKPEEMSQQQLLEFALLHELGHALLYEEFADQPEDYKNLTADERIKLPIGNASPSYLRSEEGRKFVDNKWEDIQEHLGVRTFDELLELQSKAYRKMKQEVFADNFASKILEKQSKKKRIMRRFLDKALTA